VLRCRSVDPGGEDRTIRPDGGGERVREADAALVLAARAGDERAFGRLFDRWFDPVHDIAWRIVRDRDTAAEVAQDVFLVAWQGLGDLEQPGSFGGWVRRIARNRALNRLDRERRSRPDSDATAAALDRSAPDVDMSAALGEREQNELVWAAASALGERDASVLDLHLRHGMGAPEIAAELGVTANNAHQLLHRLKGKLGSAIGAWVLWRSAAQACPGLDRAVADAGVTTFGADAVRVVDRHARGCATCDERRQLRLAPEALFAAVPIAVAPPLVKAEAAAALADVGVPMAGSTAAAGNAGKAAGDTGGSGDAGPGEAGPQPEPETGDGASPDGASDAPPTGPMDAPRSRAAAGPRRRPLVLAGLVVAVLIAGLGALLTGGDPDEVATSEPRATTTGRPTTEATAAPTTAAVEPPPSDTSPTTTAPADRTTTSTPTTTTTAPPVVPPPATPDPSPPVIGGFRGTRTGTQCGSASTTTEVALAWQSTGADSAVISQVGSGLQPSGSTTVCVGPGAQTYTLTVTGPGGTDDATVTVP
jgi:RNA polymerase sigma factor (sigma-70 family)